MYFFEPYMVVMLIGVGILAASLALILNQWVFRGRTRRSPHMVLGALDTPRSYVFHDGYLVSEHDEDEYFIADPSDRARAWAGLVEGLKPLNPDIATSMRALADRREGFLLIAQVGSDALSVSGRAQGEVVTVTVSSVEESRARHAIHKDSLDGFHDEMQGLRAAVDFLPVPMWRERSDGQITWANGAYYRLLERANDIDGPLVWPIRRLFAEQLDPLPDPGAFRRCQLIMHDQEEPSWFDVSMTDQGENTLFAARPIDQLVAAETNLRNFVQTLSKTFAHLPIGLAIFNKKRELVLFNPALLTLSTLDPEWLSSRPSLFSFLDQLRERQRMPEPKDYKAWRASLSELEQAAQDGSYQELWTLPTGQTYRVIGKPHPDGAVAFMFEDISSEVSLTRQFRSDLELYQWVLDESDGALAVFSKDGRLILSNAAYAELWGVDPREMLSTMSLVEATRTWQRLANPSPVWGDIRAFAGQEAERAAWSDDVTLADGRMLECRVAPLKGGSMVVTFQPVSRATELVDVTQRTLAVAD
ncbi:PAS domain-containing protein [Roseobacter sp. HKCCD9010]|uniref:PAS-domain containing protein n=1 Tax=unclassified Roseobacter TaxID=196798 RepID=UPI001491854D|nr:MULTISPECIES: PAS-domain containing protein [unclassified Roseobacter]MBF9051092.1 PAS domain-containing protein [Rhodobacterales bacterium HKCCD4356]NNV12861.1 PAS domain-containing protein [Roseobacter sp. HKCCD7357]NNV16806.1 PAS domain-containing protein [Roseobacter sp. HKCCD8768]NNV26562.1 PAS domain-containing protein [Roseobacter sp. HKCCD8192]NNV30527.1 PAS domain-containing protein [Roseobacter sp. HKCCD9061]